MTKMKIVGLIGGISWTSTAKYYQLLNEEVHKRLGGVHSSKILLYSLDLQEYADLASSGQFEDFKELLVDAAKRVQRAGVDFLVIASNTAHMAVPDIETQLPTLPVLHIADCCAKEIKRKNLSKVGFLGTRFTMEHPFLQERLKSHSLTIITLADSPTLTEIQRIIEEELSVNNFSNANSKVFIQSCIKRLIAEGAEGVILGCTELPLLITQEDLPNFPLLDTTTLHVNAIVDFQLLQS